MRLAIAEALLDIGLSAVVFLLLCVAYVSVVMRASPEPLATVALICGCAAPGFVLWALAILVGFIRARNATSLRRLGLGVITMAIATVVGFVGVFALVAAKGIVAESLNSNSFAGLWVVFIIPIGEIYITLFACVALSSLFVHRFLFD